MAAEPASVLDDPRWTALSTRGLACSCGETHVGMFPIHMNVPMAWPGPRQYEAEDKVRLDGDFLSANFCVWGGKQFATRMRFPLQLRGAGPNVFMFTVWASLDRPDFEGYLQALNDKRINHGARTRARLVNRLNEYPDTFGLLGTAFQQDDGGPPLLLIHRDPEGKETDHPLTVDQRNGIGFSKALDLFASYNHDMRAAAAQALA